GGHLAGLAHPLADHAQHARKLFRADGNQRDDRDDDQFTPPDVEHERFRSRRACFKSLVDPNPGRIWSGPRRFSTCNLVQTALLPTSDRAAVGAALWSIVFTGSAGLSAGLSSSAMPFLNALMPPATSPIRSEILPRPNSSRTTTITTIQCQMISEPILQTLQKH